VTGRDWAAYTALLIGVVAILLAAYSCVPARAANCPGQWVSAPFDGTSLTAAHRTLPFGTKLRVTYRGKVVVVRINDRGPYIAGRSLDLSRAAAAKIGMIEAGVGTVCVVRA
jgi:hypothetical protein